MDESEIQSLINDIFKNQEEEQKAAKIESEIFEMIPDDLDIVSRILKAVEISGKDLPCADFINTILNANNSNYISNDVLERFSNSDLAQLFYEDSKAISDAYMKSVVINLTRAPSCISFGYF